MSPLGKIFLYVALLGAAASIVLGYFVINNLNETTHSLTQTKQSLSIQTKKTQSALADADEAKKTAADTQSKLDEANTNIQTLTGQLADATKQQTDLKAAVQDSADKLSKAQAELARISSVLNGQSPEDVKAQVDKLTAQVAADNAEQKILQDQLQKVKEQVIQLTDAVNRAGQHPAPMPPGISGKVTFVNSAWGFVVLNVGLSNGVVPNGELIIYRGRDFLGKVKVSSAEDNSAVADILPGAKAEFQVGDDVLN